jgi:hypothetical protein
MNTGQTVFSQRMEFVPAYVFRIRRLQTFMQVKHPLHQRDHLVVAGSVCGITEVAHADRSLLKKH